MKYLCFILCICLLGCQSQSKTFPVKELLIAESFIAFSHATMKGGDNQTDDENPKKGCKCNGTGKERSGDGLVEVPCRCGENCKCVKKTVVSAQPESEKIKKPIKYLRYFSADAGCGACIHQDTILMGSDLIIHKGTEKDNQDKLPYHGLKETVPNLKSGNNPLWTKYKAPSVPFWQLVENDKVVKTYSGVMTKEQLYEFFINDKMVTQQQSNSCTCETCKCGTCRCN